jgi:hypothetical protein
LAVVRTIGRKEAKATIAKAAGRSLEISLLLAILAMGRATVASSDNWAFIVTVAEVVGRQPANRCRACPRVQQLHERPACCASVLMPATCSLDLFSLPLFALLSNVNTT